MKYSDICRAFYISEGKSGLNEYTTQSEIARILIELGFKEGTKGKAELIIEPTSYTKWFSGTNKPRAAVWKAFMEDFQEDIYVDRLVKKLNEEYLDKTAISLGISVPEGTVIEKKRFATAVARQMLSLAKKNGKDVEDIIKSVYVYCDADLSFAKYLNKAIDRYSVMKLIGGHEVPLEEYYICNTLGDSQRFRGNKKAFRGNHLDEATVEEIRNLFAKRKYDNKKCYLIGSGGSGKTLMLQRLFLDAARRYSSTGVLPIFLELRYFTDRDELRDFVLKTVQQKDESFSDEVAEQIFRSGKCVLLMDGLDEIDPSDIDSFHRKLEAFTDRYDNIQIILTSRDCEATNGLKQFMPLYVWPFNGEQAEQLVDKILNSEGKPEIKSQVMDYLSNGFIGKDGVFASHPMLLTFVVKNYPSFDRFHEDHILFYRRAYDALLSGHDDNKKPYDRIFRSVDDAEQFTIVFREFCALTYQDGVFKFNLESFGSYFSRLKSHKAFVNPYKMKEKSFLSDACSTACMLHEQDEDIVYIDPGFQEFLFAEYYSRAGEETITELASILKRKSVNVYGRKLEAFNMLYGLAEKKFQKYVILPFLNSIFKTKYTEEESFKRFLIEGFSKVVFLTTNNNWIEDAVRKGNAGKHLIQPEEVEPATVILTYLMGILKTPDTCSLITNHVEITYPITEDDHFPFKAFKGYLIGEYIVDPSTGETVLRGVNHLWTEMQNMEKYKETYDIDKFIQDEDGAVPILGMSWEIDTLDIEDEPEKYSQLISEMINCKCTFYHVYEKIKEYHKDLRRLERRGGLD